MPHSVLAQHMRLLIALLFRRLAFAAAAASSERQPFAFAVTTRLEAAANRRRGSSHVDLHSDTSIFIRNHPQA